MGLSWLDGSCGGESAGCHGADPCFAVGEVSAVVDGLRLAGEGSAEFIGVVGVDLFEPALDGTGRTPLGREPEAWRGYRGQRGHITVLRADDAEFYEKYAAELVRFANTLVGPSGAEDLLVDTIVTVFASAAWPSVTNKRAYVYRAMVNHAAKDRRATQRRLAREIKAGPRPEVDLRTAELGAIEVRIALRSLTVRQRAIVHLRYWSDLTVPDIARALQLPVRTVERELAAARQRLMEDLR